MAYVRVNAPNAVKYDRWKTPAVNESAVANLQRELGIQRVTAHILVSRGILEAETAERFLNPRYEDMNDARLLPDMQVGIETILAARERKDLIFIHGDYDVDGLTSAALLDRFLSKIGCSVHTHVPHRFKEGYGINASAVDLAIAKGAKLFLTCDCGSGAIEQIAKARSHGMDVVVTDHHLIPDDWPQANAFINPKRPDSEYPFKDLSGVGVVFRLCEGICRELGMPLDKYYQNFVEFAAMGTIADVMPLVGDNRIIAAKGLDVLSNTTKICLQELKKAANQDGKMSPDSVGFFLGPRLNAVGRIDDAGIGLELLLCRDEARVKELVAIIEDFNTQRRAEQDRIVQEAVDQVEKDELFKKPIIVVGSEGWHQGIVGIVAGKIRELYYRPTFVLTYVEEDKIWKGSGRSIDAFHLADAIKANAHLMGGGGHAKAAGCHFHQDNYGQVCEALEQYAASVLTDEDLVPVSHVDAALDASEVRIQLLDELDRLEPFGTGNPRPSFVVAGAVRDLKPTKDGNHYRMSLVTASGSATPAFTVFGAVAEYPDLAEGSEVEYLFSLKENLWNGKRKVDLKGNLIVASS